MSPDFFDGFAGQVSGQLWAGLVLVAWLAAGARAVRIPPFIGWAPIERAALVYAIAMAGLASSTLLLGRNLGERDLLLLLPPRSKMLDRAATELDIHAMTGVFLAAPSHPGYPGIGLPRSITTVRADLYERALALQADALCDLAPLWIYAREPLLPTSWIESTRLALRNGVLREAQAWETSRGRHVIYEACPRLADSTK